VRTTRFVLAVACVVFGLAVGSSRAQGPLVVPFQGLLTDQLGKTLQISSPVQLIFRIYRDPVGGAALWEEVQAGITVIQGRFSVLLGSRQPLRISDFRQTVYLGVTVDDGDPTTIDVEMRPRQAVVPVLFARAAGDSETLLGHTWADLLSGGASDPSIGKVRGDRIAIDTNVFNANQVLGIKDGAIREELLADGSVTTKKISVGSISTERIADQSVTPKKRSPLIYAESKVFTGTIQSPFQCDASWRDVVPVSVEIASTGRPLFVSLAGSGYDGLADVASAAKIYIAPPNSNVPNPQNGLDLRITRDDTATVFITEFNLFQPGLSGGIGLSGTFPIDMFGIDVPNEGKHSYKLQVKCLGNQTLIGITGYTLRVFEL